MRLAAVLILLLSGIVCEACPPARVIAVRKDVVIQQEVVLVPVIYYQPTYSISYQPPATIIYPPPTYQPAPLQARPQQERAAPQDCCDAVLLELRALRAEIAAMRGQPVAMAQPQTYADVIRLRCASCHEAGVVQAKGSKLALLTGINLAELSLAEKRNLVNMVGTAKMPKGGPPLSQREREIIFAEVEKSLGKP